MAKIQSYQGSIDLISGLRPKNNGDFPLLEAHDVLVDEKGTRLDEKIKNSIQAVLTSDEMDRILADATNADVGSFYLYIGETTDTYENGAVYKIGVT